MTNQPATERQIEYLTMLLGGPPPEGLSKPEASKLIDRAKHFSSVRVAHPKVGEELIYPKDFPAKIAEYEEMAEWEPRHLDAWAEMVFGDLLPANQKDWVPGRGGEVVRSIRSIIQGYGRLAWKRTPDGPQPLTTTKRREAATWRPADIIAWARAAHGDALDALDSKN